MLARRLLRTIPTGRILASPAHPRQRTCTGRTVEKERTEWSPQPLVSRDTLSAGFLERFVAVIIDGLRLLVPNLIVVIVLGSGLASNLVNLVIGIAYALYF
jgi:hypothetical protein